MWLLGTGSQERKALLQIAMATGLWRRRGESTTFGKSLHPSQWLHSVSGCLPSILQAILITIRINHMTILPGSYCHITGFQSKLQGWVLHLLFFKIILFCVHECFTCTYVCASHVYLVLEEVRRGHQSPWSYKWLWATVWMLGMESRSFVRASKPLNHWAISLVPIFVFVLRQSLITQLQEFRHVILLSQPGPQAWTTEKWRLFEVRISL